jgi:hypothetical protein
MEPTQIFIAALVLSLVALAGLLVRRYLKIRKGGFEDRFMALYAKEDWDASNMDLVLTFPKERDEAIKALFLQRLADYLENKEPETSLFHEVADTSGERLAFHHDQTIQVEDLLTHRKGIWFVMDKVGEIKVVWSHIQADGLRIWREIRPLFDPNPHILPFSDMKPPLPVVPELLSLPTTIRSMGFQSHLTPQLQGKPERSLNIWSTAPIKAIKNKLKGSFNLVSTSMLLEELFHHHRETDKLTVGLTVAFPFLEAKNKYGVYTLEVKRGNFEQIYQQVVRQVKSPMTIWGNFSNQSLALSMLSDKSFLDVLSRYRGKIDVLVSNLPVGAYDIEMGEAPVQIACHTDELTIPYYFLLLGTKSHIHLSCTTKFPIADEFLAQDRILSRLQLHSPAFSPTLEAAPSNR